MEFEVSLSFYFLWKKKTNLKIISSWNCSLWSDRTISLILFLRKKFFVFGSKNCLYVSIISILFFLLLRWWYTRTYANIFYVCCCTISCMENILECVLFMNAHIDNHLFLIECITSIPNHHKWKRLFLHIFNQ